MSKVALVGAALRMAYQHPKLIQSFLQGRFRMAGVRREQLTGNGYSAKPLGITLKPTLSCNLRCIMCSYAASGAVRANPRDSLPLETYKRLVDDVVGWKPYIWFTGGEPTLYPDILPLLSYIRERGLVCGMTSNGTTLTKVADGIVANPMDLLVVSLDGRGEVHDKVRGNPRAFQRAYAGVEALQAAKKAAKAPHPAVVISTALTPESFRQAHEMVDVAQELGAVALNVQHLWMMTASMIADHNARWGDEQYVDPEEWASDENHGMDPREVVEAVEAIRRKPSRIPIIFQPDMRPEEIVTYYQSPATFVRRRPAVCAWVNTDILPTGDVSPCFGVVCGNISTERFTDIWNGEEFKRHRQRLSVEGDLPICARCCAYWRRD